MVIGVLVLSFSLLDSIKTCIHARVPQKLSMKAKCEGGEEFRITFEKRVGVMVEGEEEDLILKEMIRASLIAIGIGAVEWWEASMVGEEVKEVKREGDTLLIEKQKEMGGKEIIRIVFQENKIKSVKIKNEVMEGWGKFFYEGEKIVKVKARWGGGDFDVRYEYVKKKGYLIPVKTIIKDETSLFPTVNISYYNISCIP